ncbi:heme ABC transporter ATP-binding protein [Neptunomonas antarctica]|uniref:Iron complex transport system ATP-binding protein n=1 Tax=Neptunomonas antarctica TaxID=619304 RepID=A0A1N7PMA6_9GAMM|nr:heme ABC transporter ATP-binding protein [Neptunomonas antarctica]SIT11519.1 iron complex transport system ATP-binding protein [Neptunomonas antarctica]
MLSAESLSVIRHGRALLDNASMEVKPGSLHVILGPNGAGKTTLLKTLAGLIAADIGRVALEGKNIEEYSVSERSLTLAVLLQEQLLDFPFHVREVVSMGAYPIGAVFSQQNYLADKAMTALDIQHLADRDYTTLSGGEKQRTHLARLLVQISAKTAYVLLDEPLKAIDLKHQVAVMQQIRTITNQGKAVLLIVHDLSLAAQFADTITLMDSGRIVMTGTPAQVMQPDILSELFQTPIGFTEVLGQPLFFTRSTI